MAAINTGSADVVTTLNDAEDYADLQKNLNQGELLKNSLPKNEEVEKEESVKGEESSENAEEKKEDNTTEEIEKEAVQDEGKGSPEQDEKNKKDEEKVEGIVSEVQESTNNEKVDSNEKSWTYDNGVVVMEVSSSDATAKGVADALESVHSKADITSLIVSEIKTFAGEGTGSSASHFQEYKVLKTVNLPRVTTIGAYAFANAALKTANFPEVTMIGGSAFSMSGIRSINAPKVATIDNSVFYGVSSLKTLDLPEIKSLSINVFVNSGIELITTRDGKQDVVNSVIKADRILGVVTDTLELEDQTLLKGDSLSLSNLAIINDSPTDVKATVSSSWEKDGEKVGTGLTYSVDSVSKTDAGVYQNTLNVTLSDGTTAGSFSTNEAKVTVVEEGGTSNGKIR